jgi:hypothetical protein
MQLIAPKEDIVLQGPFTLRRALLEHFNLNTELILSRIVVLALLGHIAQAEDLIPTTVQMDNMVFVLVVKLLHAAKVVMLVGFVRIRD